MNFPSIPKPVNVAITYMSVKQSQDYLFFICSFLEKHIYLSSCFKLVNQTTFVSNFAKMNKTMGLIVDLQVLVSRKLYKENTYK